jgi:hypothetical protein
MAAFTTFYLNAWWSEIVLKNELKSFEEKTEDKLFSH